MVLRTVREWEEFGLVQKLRVPTHGIREWTRVRRINQEEDLQTTLKLNVAASVPSHHGNSVGVGWILRKENGGVILTESETKCSIGNHYIVELEVVKIALLVARRWKAQNIKVGLDVKTIMSWLQKKIPPVSNASVIVADILLLKLFFAHCSFVFILK